VNELNEKTDTQNDEETSNFSDGFDRCCASNNLLVNDRVDVPL